MTHATPTPTRALRRLAWGLCAAILVATVAAALWLLREQPAGNAVQAIADLTTVIAFAVFGVTGALILSHQPRHTVGRLMMLEGTLIFAWPVSKYYESLAAPPAQPSALFLLGLWLRQLVVAVADLSAVVRHPVLSHGQAAFAALALAAHSGAGACRVLHGRQRVAAGIERTRRTTSLDCA